MWDSLDSYILNELDKENNVADFNDEHKQEQGNYFGEGIHKVKIMTVIGGTTDAGKEFIEFTVVGDNDEEGSARVWFTTDKAIRYSFNTIRGIFVHNAMKGKEEAAREMVNAVKDTDELVELCNKVLIGKEAYYTVEKSDYKYTNAAGEEKQGYNRNISGYEPKPKPTQQSGNEAVDSTFGGGEVMDSNDIPNDL